MKKSITEIYPSENALKQPIVFYDSDCGLCNRTVKFLLRQNKSGNLMFSSLSSATASLIFRNQNIDTSKNDSFYFFENNVLTHSSTAALKVCHHLGFPWRLAANLQLIPVSFRDAIYRFIAKNRHRLPSMNKSATVCSIADNERFLK